jgi:hypothetical protein
LSDGGRQSERIFSLDLMKRTICARNEDPAVLIKGAFFYEDPQGKNQLSPWLEKYVGWKSMLVAN